MMIVVIASILPRVDTYLVLTMYHIFYMCSPWRQLYLTNEKTEVLPQAHTVGKWSLLDCLTPQPVHCTPTGASCPGRPQRAGSEFSRSNRLYMDRSLLTPQSNVGIQSDPPQPLNHPQIHLFNMLAQKYVKITAPIYWIVAQHPKFSR